MRPGPQVYVQTRGAARAADYAFLGAAPPHPWWREYRDATAFDHPTVLVVSWGGSWAAYLSGVPSARTDAVGTVVRWTLVLDGHAFDPVAATLPAAVAAWLDDVAEGAGGPPGPRLSTALDAHLPADDVQRLLTAAPPPPSAVSDLAVVGEPGRRVLDALATLPAPAATGASTADPPGSWVGGVGSALARAAFVARVAALVGGAPGRALLLNLTGPDDAAAVAGTGSPTAVLVDGDAPVTPLRGGVEAKKAPSPAASRSRTVPAGIAVVLTALAAVAVLLVVLVALVL